mmetsp:Transcript_9395/g.20288  ORF Transcript_9395/g.20288 Transcript_9395/m.20288 type:complete len:181 (+) Transcript_9395:255-797(+)
MISLTKVLATCSPFLWAISSTNAFTSQPPPRTASRVLVGGIEEPRTPTRCFAKKNSADMTDEEREVAMDKALKAMTAFSNKYTTNTGTYYCEDKGIPAVVIKGLAEHKVTLGTPLCPCRFYEDKEKEAKEGYWNCPCAPMRERHECHCMLFLTEENDFAGDDQTISYEEVKERCGGCEGL